MKYRSLGNTGLLVSEIGVGYEGFIGKTDVQTKEFIDLMKNEGVNCIDLYTPKMTTL